MNDVPKKDAEYLGNDGRCFVAFRTRSVTDLQDSNVIVVMESHDYDDLYGRRNRG